MRSAEIRDITQHILRHINVGLLLMSFLFKRELYFHFTIFMYSSSICIIVSLLPPLIIKFSSFFFPDIQTRMHSRCFLHTLIPQFTHLLFLTFKLINERHFLPTLFTQLSFKSTMKIKVPIHGSFSVLSMKNIQARTKNTRINQATHF